MNIEEQINQHIEMVLRVMQRHGGRMLHSPLLYKCQYSMNAKVLRIVLERMKAKGLIVERWDHEEHSYTVQGGDSE